MTILHFLHCPRLPVRELEKQRRSIVDGLHVGGNPGCAPAFQPAMLTWAIIFGICALIFGLLGFSGLAAGFATIARFLLALFLILLVLVLIFGGTLFHTAVR
jgi:uncharacterized membrane protein YtjA (UPF0391 family)